jgi:superfamily II DNA or RNA helicase
MQTYSLDKNINLPQPVYDALAALNDANFFSDGLLVGSWALLFYKELFGIEYVLRTDDIDFALRSDAITAYQEGRKVLVLTERTEHLSLLRDALGGAVETCFVLHGRLSKKQRAAVLSGLDELDESAPRVLLATGRLVGEGFDHPPLDTLVLAMPISWKGTLQQYAGRLHRGHASKEDVRIYDYIEQDHPQLVRMWDKRLRGYRAMGYEVCAR